MAIVPTHSLPTVTLTAATEGADRLDADTPTSARVAAGIFARKAERSAVDVTGLSPEVIEAITEGLLLGSYRFTLATGNRPKPRRLELAGGAGSAAAEDAVRRGRLTAEAACWSRTLANTRSNVKTPQWLAGQAAAELTPLGVEVVERDVTWLTEQRFGGVLAVGGGSASPPRLIEARWRPRGARKGIHVVLVGKGITFDSGGINRKPGAAMNTMYTDMAGGAAVLGALRAIAATKVPLHVTALVPAAENLMSGGSFRPGDVIRHHGGRTSEIGNTDAEGRLVLADAIAYAAGSLRPTAIVDIATLTGAAKMALGLRTGALFATSEPLADGLLAAAGATGESLWRLPMPADYDEQLESPIADANNSAGNPGAITAAAFLRSFTRGVEWAHLDIAGPARAASDAGLVSRGATGFGARLLHAWAVSLTA